MIEEYGKRIHDTMIIPNRYSSIIWDKFMLIKWKGFKKLNGTKILGWPSLKRRLTSWKLKKLVTTTKSRLTHQQPLTRTKLHQVFSPLCQLGTLDPHRLNMGWYPFYLDWNLMKIASDYPSLGNSLPVYHLGNYLPRVLESSTPEEVAVLVSVAVSRWLSGSASFPPDLLGF